MLTPKLIAVDWGTTNFRAYLLGERAKVLQMRRFPRGILHVKPSQFRKTFEKLLRPWLTSYQSLPVLMCGMVGSRQGWQEVPYLHCPIPLSSLRQGIKKISDFDREALIVPGISCEREGLVDVMRGEETQLLGALQHTKSDNMVFCVPGTHTKWVRVLKGSVSEFSTYMTGELFALLSQYSILSRQMRLSKQIDWLAFAQGVDRAIVGERYWLSDLFQIRAQVLTKKLSRHVVKDYLSGLLTGYEILQARTYWEDVAQVIIIASDVMAERYKNALSKLDRASSVVDVYEATVKGLWYLAQEK